MAAFDDMIGPILEELRACLCAELSDTVPCFCGVVVGPVVPLEYAGGCSDCGAAYVQLRNAFPTSNFPEPDFDATCNTVMAFTVAVAVARCLPLGDDDGSLPTVAEMKELADETLADMAAIRRAIVCCLGDDKFEDIQYQIGQYEPFGPETGVAGGEWTLVISERF